jgi:hypothetical protein
VAVILEARACRNEPAHRDVLLQAAQVIDLAGSTPRSARASSPGTTLRR